MDFPSYAFIPTIVKHMTVAIYRDGKISARNRKDRFIQCFQIAKSRCAQYGFIVLGGNGLVDNMALTPKGRKAELKHKREGGSKRVLFDTLFQQYDLDGSKEKFAQEQQQKAAELKLNAQEQAKSDATEKANPPAGTPGQANAPKAAAKAPKPKKYSKKDIL